MCVKVDQRERDAHGRKIEEGNEQRESVTVKFPRNNAKEDTRAQFDDRVAHRDWGLARAAFAAKQQPRKHRDVVIALNAHPASRTRTRWGDNRSFERDSIYDDIEERTYKRAEYSDEDCHVNSTPNLELTFGLRERLFRQELDTVPYLDLQLASRPG